MYGLGNYVIHPGAVEKILVMNNKIMTLGYTYAKCRLKNPPMIFYEIAHIGKLISWTPSIYPGLRHSRGGTDTIVVKRQTEEVGKRAPDKLRAQENHKHKTRARLKKVRPKKKKQEDSRINLRLS